MNKIIEFIKRLFNKNILALNEGSISINEKNSNKKENFLNNIKVENEENDILLLQIKIEQGIIDESDLNDKQIIKMKKLYYNQISNLLDSINEYKLKIKWG